MTSPHSKVCLVAVLATMACGAPFATELFAADPIVLEGLAGERLSEAELERGTTIVVVWASWSPHCRDVVSRVNALSAAWSARARVVTVVFQEDAESVRAFLAGQGLKAPVYLDTSGAFSKKHAVTTLPGLLIFQDGKRGYGGRLPPDADALIARTLG